MPQLTIREATSPSDISSVAELFREYEAAIGVDLCFQGFEAELAGLPGHYAAPHGALFLLLAEDQAIGCVALRPLELPDVAELKRLYVRPAFRIGGSGRRLAVAAIERARAAGYDRVRLDTLSTMVAAQRLYESLGFADVDPYCFNPLEGVRYMELSLRS